MDRNAGRLNLCIIAAMTPDRVIGKNGALPWKLKSDLKRFRELTLGHDVVMGYYTFHEILERLGKPLELRRNFVVTRRHRQAVLGSGAIPVESVLEPLAKSWDAGKELFVLGGSSVFQAALPYVDRMFLTLVDAYIAGGIHFPLFDPAQWRQVNNPQERAELLDPDDEYPTRFIQYERIRDAV